MELSRFRVSGLLPVVGAGTTLNFHPDLRATAGIQAGFASPLANDGVDVLWRAELGISYVL